MIKGKGRQSGEIPLAHVLMLALVVLPVVIGMIYFITAAEEKVAAGGTELKKERGSLEKKVKELGDAFK